MTFQEFLNKWNGKYCEVGGPTAVNQCVDLANAYITEVLKEPAILWTNAKDFPSKAGENYEYIVNTPTGVPQEGDLIIWNGTSYGHIGVFIEGNANSFRSLDQNYPTGSPVHVQNHTYKNVQGWLRHKKGTGQSVELQECLKQHTELIDKLNKKDVYITELTNEIDGLKAQIKSHEDYIKQLATTLNTEVNENKILGEVTKLISTSDSLLTCQGNVESLRSEASLNAQKRLELQKTMNTLSEELKQVKLEKTALEIAHNETRERYNDTKGELVECQKSQKFDPIFKIGKYFLCKEVKK